DANDPQQKYWVQTSRRATVEGTDLVDAQPAFDSRTGEPIVTFRFNQKGALKFGRLTQANVGKPFAIILDGKVVSAPVIQTPILGGTGQISGRFTVEETKLLAIVLRSGALPAKLTIVEERTVGPSLGSDSIRAGITASIIGLIAVLAFMIFTYGLFGIFADIALLANLGMLVGVLTAFQATLTLPGIAGIVLTLGMAVDSNVLVFERVREELRAGRGVLNALETGFSRAFATILDANITTLIAAVVLYGLGSGPVRGFAVTLGVGIVTTVFTAYTLTRLIVAIWVRRTRPKALPL
ncbi:MAG TPA: protein translocase subunit SecD, partial [Bryobacterales bacterium]|nr:protein translocase subunit SecD [Bryobacterales bacterium]